MKRYLLLVKREFALFFSNRVMLLLYLGGPILYGVVFGAVYTKGKVTDLPIVVIDQDNSALSARFIDMLEENEALIIRVVRYENAAHSVRRDDAETYGTVIIPRRFQADVMQRKHPEVNAYINNTNLLPAGYVMRAIVAVAVTLKAHLAAAAGRPAEAFHVNTYRLFNPASNYFAFIWPSYLAVILQSVVLVVLALSFASENENHTLPAVYQQSGSVVRLLLAKVTPYWLLGLIILGIYGGYFLLFKVNLPEHLLQAVAVALLFIASISFQGIIAGALFKEQIHVLQLLMILSMPAYISSGFSWPFMYYGWVAKCYGLLFPMMPFINGFRILLIEHGRFTDIQDFMLLQALQLVGYFLLAWLVLAIKTRKLPLSPQLGEVQLEPALRASMKAEGY